MKKITTNLANPHTVVLTESTGKIVGVLPLKAGQHDITDRVIQAIYEDSSLECEECVTILTDAVVEFIADAIPFTVEIIDELDDNDPTQYDFEIVFTAEY